jgi:hypothetical protein
MSAGTIDVLRLRWHGTNCLSPGFPDGTLIHQ